MNTIQPTATEHLKTFGPNGDQFIELSDLRSYMDAKGFDLSVVAKIAEQGSFASLFSHLVLRTSERINYARLNAYVDALRYVEPTERQVYTGTDAQNGKIDAAIANSGRTLGLRRHGEGSASQFLPVVQIPGAIRTVPIAIVGYGAAGIMADFALRSLGFTNITVYEKAKALGIWGHNNVFTLSRNNPLKLQFFNSTLEPAPGGGDEVKAFLERLAVSQPRDLRVDRVTPGTLQHTLHFAGGTTKKFPIVINAVGLGKPKPVSDLARMVTKTGERLAGIRWQYKLEREKVVGQRIVLIGLGNSTAEMLRQIHTFTDQGYPIEYRVLTHYPKDAVYNPSDYVPKKGRTYRVFRDISKPNLVDYQGDLAHSRYDYFRALHEGRIVSDVKRWEVKTPGLMSTFGHDAAGKAKPIEDIPFDKVMTLIGYEQPPETMKALGCTYDTKNKCGVFDYDGEVAAKPGEKDPAKRLHKGCFGFGSILQTPHNPNAIVIPGMLHRVGDLMFGVIMRAAEYRKREILRQ